MKYLLSIFLLFLITAFLYTSPVHAQMMRNVSPMMRQGSVTPSVQDTQDIQKGQELFNKFQTRQLNCTLLKDKDFEKIGEYLMNQSFGGNTVAHVQMNNNMKQMMGENGEEQMHIRLAKNATGCYQKGQGGVENMMGWGGYNMMDWNSGFAIIPFLIHIFILVDLILLAVWLWKRIKK